MWARIIFSASVLLAVLVVVLLAMVSPTPHNKLVAPKNQTKPPWLALSLYIQQPRPIGAEHVAQSDAAAGGALIFHRTLTEGPDNTSRVVGKAQGFIIPVERFAHSDFNILYLSFDTAEYSGSLSVQAKRVAHKDAEELTVVGGTGSFAFARGLAVFAHTAVAAAAAQQYDDHQSSASASSSDVDVATYHVKLRLTFPKQSRTIPG